MDSFVTSCLDLRSRDLTDCIYRLRKYTGLDLPIEFCRHSHKSRYHPPGLLGHCILVRTNVQDKYCYYTRKFPKQHEIPILEWTSDDLRHRYLHWEPIPEPLSGCYLDELTDGACSGKGLPWHYMIYNKAWDIMKWYLLNPRLAGIIRKHPPSWVSLFKELPLSEFESLTTHDGELLFSIHDLGGHGFPCYFWHPSLDLEKERWFLKHLDRSFQSAPEETGYRELLCTLQRRGLLPVLKHQAGVRDKSEDFLNLLTPNTIWNLPEIIGKIIEKKDFWDYLGYGYDPWEMLDIQPTYHRNGTRTKAAK